MLGNAGWGRFSDRTGYNLPLLVPASDQIRFLSHNDLMLMAFELHYMRQTVSCECSGWKRGLRRVWLRVDVVV
jgi:hypothetical protein